MRADFLSRCFPFSTKSPLFRGKPIRAHVCSLWGLGWRPRAWGSLRPSPHALPGTSLGIGLHPRVPLLHGSRRGHTLHASAILRFLAMGLSPKGSCGRLAIGGSELMALVPDPGSSEAEAGREGVWAANLGAQREVTRRSTCRRAWSLTVFPGGKAEVGRGTVQRQSELSTYRAPCLWVASPSGDIPTPERRGEQRA